MARPTSLCTVLYSDWRQGILLKIGGGTSIASGMERPEPVRVLVAEDSATERALCISVLADAGLEAHEAPDGRYALDLCRIIHPDLLILDLGLPRVSGIEVLRKLRDDYKIGHTPVIVLTADERQETADLAFYEGATDFVTKPVDPVELIARVREALSAQPAG